MPRFASDGEMHLVGVFYVQHHRILKIKWNFLEYQKKVSIVHNFIIITARVRSMREGNIYTLECLSVYHWFGGGYPIPGPVREGGRYPIPGLDGGYPFQGPGGGYPIPGLDGGTPPLHPDLGWVTPHPDLGWGTPPVQTLDRVHPPQSRTEWGTPPSPGQKTEQHSEHLLRGGRYASCVHAGGLSCLYLFD